MKKIWEKMFAKNSKMLAEDAHSSIDIDKYLRYGINVLLHDHLSKVGGYIADNPIAIEIRDVSELPYPKTSIVRLLILGLLFEDNEKKYNAMEVVLTRVLPHFQEGIGNKQLNPGGSKYGLIDLFKIDDNKYLDEAKEDGFESNIKLKEKYDINQEKVFKDISEMYEILNVIRKYRLL